MVEIPRPLRPVVFVSEEEGLEAGLATTCLICFSKGTSESLSESIIFSADLTFGLSLLFFVGAALVAVETTVSLAAVFAVAGSLGVTLVDFFFVLMIPPPTLRTGFAASSSAGRLAGTTGVVCRSRAGESTGFGVMARGRAVSLTSLSVLFFGISDSTGGGGNFATISACFFSTISRSLLV